MLVAEFFNMCSASVGRALLLKSLLALLTPALMFSMVGCAAPAASDPSADVAPAPVDPVASPPAKSNELPPVGARVVSEDVRDPTTQPVTVVEDTLPIAYLADFPGVFKIVELPLNLQIAQVALETGEILLVDRKGVFIGRRQFARGPLEGSRYQVIWLPSAPNESRQVLIGPESDVARPTTRPSKP